VDDVSQAITDMVTQSGGPYTAAAMGMALAVDQAKRENKDISSFCKDAAYKLSHARPTTTERMQIIVNESAQRIDAALEAGEGPVEAAFNFAIENLNRRYAATRKVAGYLVACFPDKGVVMTQCFAETILGMMALECEQNNKQISFICPETRPYLQGARLTASVLHDQGFEVHVVTDNMPGYIINREKVDVFTSAADVICMDGHVVNKIGTFQIALAANYWGIPYFVTGTPNTKHPTIDTVEIEERNHDLVTTIYGTKVVKDGVKAYYPAFDVTPPYLCSGVVTPKGIFSPYDLGSY
jgi:methylthioribose-1-phosphate isomerase